MTIYTPSGAALYEAPITTSAIIKRLLMGDYYIELSLDAVERIDISRGCYILYEGRKFEIMNNVLPEDTDKGGLRYTLRFEAQQSHMKRCKVFWLDSDNREVTFGDTTSISVFGDLIVRNVNKFLGTDNWSLGSVPSGLNSTFKTVSFNGDFCWDAVNNIAETFGVEWWTDEDGDKVSLCFGKLEIGNEVEFRKGGIVSSIPSKKGDSADYGTRFYVFGSTKNLPEDYASSEEGGITNHVVEKRLHLPDGITYIDAREDLAPEDIVEQVVFFDGIFPVNTDEVSAVYTSYEEVIEGQQDSVYTIYSENTPFTPENSIEGEQVQCKFTSGSLTGQTFDVEFNTTSFDKRFKIVPNILDEEGGVIIPNKDLYPKAGDTFILTGIKLPQERITEAEHLLLDAGKEYAKKNSNDTDVYDCPTNAVHCHKNNCNYDLGQRVILVGEKFGDGRSSRIQGYVKKLYDEYQATYTVGDNSAYSRLASVEKAVKKSSYSDRVGLEANIIRSKSDSTIPSDYNVYSALAVEEYFLNKRRGGIVKGFTSFQNGIAIGNIKIEFDKDSLALRIGGNLYTIGGITAGGPSEGESGGLDINLAEYVKHTELTKTLEGYLPKDTIEQDYALKSWVLKQIEGLNGSGGEVDLKLYDWSDYTVDKASYVLSALLGNDLNTRVKVIEEAGYVDEKWVLDQKFAYDKDIPSLEGYAKLADIPSLDGYATRKWVEDQKYLTGITSTMVVSALEYTPYNSANFTKDNIKSTLGISDWALASSLEWTAINGRPTKLSDFTDDVVNGNFLPINATAKDSEKFGGQVPAYYATASTLNTLSQTVANFKSLFDSMFEVVDGNIHAKLSLWSSGGITAGGVGSGGSGGGGGISYSRLDSWADYSADKAGYVLSALLGKDLDNRVSALANAGYITASYLAPYALRSEIPSLVGYATESWVNTALAGYLPLSGGTLTDALTVKGSGSPLTVHRTQPLASVVKFVNTDGNLGWLGVDIDKTAIFIEASGVIKKLLHSGNYADYITNSYIKSTLGISDWALASTKPTYTASEVGALGVNDTAINANKLGGYLPTTYMRASGQYTDSLNDLTSLGIYRMSGTIKDGPTGAGGYGNLMVVRSNSWDTLSQLYFNANNNRIFVRSGTNSNFTSKDWSTLALTSDIPTKLSQLTDDVVAGNYLSKSGGKLVYSGAQGLEAERTDGAPTHIMFLGLVNGTSRQLGGFGMNGYNDPVYVNPNGIRHKVLTAENYSDYALSKYGGTVNGSITANSFIGGTSTISGDLNGLQNLIFADGYLGRKFSLTNSGGVFYQAPSGSVGWATNWSVKSNDGITSFGDLVGAFGVGDSLSYFYFGGEYNAPSIAIMPSGMIAIGGTTANEKLHVHGNGKFTGALTANSLTIGGVTLTYDSVNEALCINGNMYALGGITAGGTGISTYSSLEARVARLEQQLNI